MEEPQTLCVSRWVWVHMHHQSSVRSATPSGAYVNGNLFLDLGSPCCQQLFIAPSAPSKGVMYYATVCGSAVARAASQITDDTAI